MDEIWVDSTMVANNLQNILTNHNCNTKVQAIPPSLDVEQLPPFDSPSVSIRTTSPQLQNKFIFYYIGNILESKSGFKELYIAYLNAFNITDPVTLLLGLDNTLSEERIEQCLSDYKKMVAFAKPPTEYPPIHIVNPE